MMKKLLLPLGAITILLLMVAYMAGSFSDRIEPGIKAITTIDVSAAVPVQLKSGLVLEPVPASVEAKEATVISSRLLARISSVKVRAGDYVEAGQLLLELEKGDLQARAQQAREQVRSVEARLTETKQNLERAEELHRRGLIAVADRDAARADAASMAADLSSAKQALEEAEAAVGFSEIRSPIAGRVVERFAEPGDTASPGAILLSLYNPFSLWVEARVREQLAISLEKGAEVQVEIPAVNQRYKAKVAEIVPAADPGSRTFMVKTVLPSGPSLLPGMYARLLVPAGERTRALIPQARVARVGQLDVVWVVEDGRVLRRFVRLGQSTDDGMVEVLSGLGEDAMVMPVP
jgi:membrane fusion protein (multidrug efflux system)